MHASCGRGIILTPLFNQFIKSDNPSNELDKHIEIASEILEARDDKPKQQYINVKMDELPKQIIGEISSYFKQNEHSIFSRLNRATYIASKSPTDIGSYYIVCKMRTGKFCKSYLH